MQGRHSDVIDWLSNYERMSSKIHVELVLLAYDQPVHKCTSAANTHPHVTCIHHSHISWTEGRNMLARELHKREESLHSTLKYWVFADSDTRILNCQQCQGLLDVGNPNSTLGHYACCLDHIVFFLLGPQAFSLVSVVSDVKRGSKHTQSH